MAPGPLRLAAPAFALVLLAALIGAVVARPAPTSRPGARVTSGPDLLRLLESARATSSTLDVIADVAVDGGQLPPPRDRECTPLGHCRVVGVLTGFDADVGVVVVRDIARVAPPRTSTDDLAAPVTLRIGPGPIEFLGHYAGVTENHILRVPEALAETERTADGHVLAVEGWLTRRPATNCGPHPGPGAVAPFTCAIRDYIAPTQPTTPGNAAPAPPDALAVQRGAFHQVLARPDDRPPDSVFGTFLVRLVVTTQSSCPLCRGWLVVGRLDAQPQPLPPSVVAVISPGELTAALAADRAGQTGRVVFVDGRVDPGTCEISGACMIGLLAGTDEEVTATDFTRDQILVGGSGPDGILALRVRNRGLEYLGIAGDDVADVFWTHDALADQGLQNRTPLVVAVAQGWLIAASGMPCPKPLIDPAPDTPFGCPFAWLTPEETREPSAIRVPFEAYETHAPDPAYDGAHTTVPRFGTYVLRLVADLRPDAQIHTGWQVVGRLAP